MERYLLKKDQGASHVAVPYRGAALLRHPLFNKGTAFTRAERAMFGLEGLLPDGVSTMDQQARRVYANIVRKTDPLEQFIGLAALQDRNEHLFYRVLSDHLDELLPIVYSPTVGQACRQFSRIFRRARGLWITPAHQGRMAEVLGGAPYPDARLVVVGDNERILGEGDQGAGGMGIPIGKLALYTVAAGIHPALTLPISLDVGTDNPALLDDELYLGWRWPRLRGSAYDAFVDEFVHAVKLRFPHAVLQWEDLGRHNAFRLLDRYRRTLPSYNDDVQATGATVLAAMLSAEGVTGTKLADERVVIVGAGCAGIGTARLLREAFTRAGVPADELDTRIAVLDHQGFLCGRDIVGSYKHDFTWPEHVAADHGIRARASLEEVVRKIRPTVLVGACGQQGVLTQGAVHAMASHVERPVVLPLGYPAERTEADPSDVMAWTDGRALVAAGGPGGVVGATDRSIRVTQASSLFVFPGVGLGTVVAKATQVTDGMFLAAARAVADAVTTEERGQGALFPPVWRLREVTARVAEAVVRAARDEGAGLPLENGAAAKAVHAAMWEPVYPAYDVANPPVVAEADRVALAAERILE
jgi:malic enzyme